MADKSQKLDVTFATKCYEKDWTKFLSGAFERKLPNYPFKDCILYLNNGVPLNVDFKCNTSDVIPKIDEVLEFFKLNDLDFKGGLFYSIAELTAIYECKTKYLCWVQGDTILTTDNNFVKQSIKILESEEDVSVVSPLSSVNTWHDDNKKDHFFSDQCFIVRTEEFKKSIYNHDTPILNEYPSYAGVTFERLVGRYLHNTGKFRQILEDSWCEHPAY